MDSNYDKLKDNIAKGLMGNANILIQSKHADDNNDLVLDAVEKAGLRLFSMELGDPSKVRLGTWKNAEEREEQREKTIRSHIKNEKANALLVDMHPESDISTFVKVARDLNIPLIVSMTKDVELKAEVYNDKEILFNVVKGNEAKVDSKDDVVARIKGLQAQAVQENSNKLRM
jgi:methionine synthase II (cobalamin-independent)